MIYLYVLVALITAPSKILVTLHADPRMECELAHVEPRQMFGGIYIPATLSIPYCAKRLQINYDGSYTMWVEIGLRVTEEDLRGR